MEKYLLENFQIKYFSCLYGGGISVKNLEILKIISVFGLTVDGLSTTYELEGDRVISMTKQLDANKSVQLDFVYDSNSKLIGLNANGNNYFYLRDVTGNILGVINSDGDYVVKYSYDAWGVPTKNVNASYSADTAALYNPFIYKGYLYDDETGWYYLKSRYYSPEICRFISPDNISYIDSQTHSGLNIFAYCGNNPIMYADPNGCIGILIAILIGAAIGAVISATTSVITQMEENDGDTDKINEGEVVFDAIVGAINGGLATSGIGKVTSIVIGSVLGGGSRALKDLWFGDRKIDIWGVVDSAIIGGISGAISGEGANYAKNGSHVTNYIASNDILKKTIVNGTKKYIPRQTHAMLVHSKELVISGVRYLMSNTFSMITEFVH